MKSMNVQSFKVMLRSNNGDCFNRMYVNRSDLLEASHKKLSFTKNLEVFVTSNDKRTSMLKHLA